MASDISGTHHRPPSPIVPDDSLDESLGSWQANNIDRKQTRKRASRPKARTGCVNCKRRHLKCDERKPTCERCENFGISCEGYASPEPAKKKQPARVERLLLPRTTRTVQRIDRHRSCQDEHGDVGLVRDEDQRLPKQLSSGLQLDEQDGWYFDLFRHYAVHDMNPNYDSEFWTRVLVRESMFSEAIRHSVLSIGAHCRAILSTQERKQRMLAESLTNSRGNTGAHWMDIWQDRHQHAALVHHAQALACVRRHIGTNGTDTRLIMIATLLFVLFENMQGNYHASGNLVKTGIKMLYEGNEISRTNVFSDIDLAIPAERSPSEKNRGDQTSFVARKQAHLSALLTMNSEVAEMAQMFARHSVMSLFVPFPHSKSAYHLLLDSQLTSAIYKMAISPNASTLRVAQKSWDYYLPYLGTFIQKCSWHNMHPAYDFDDQRAAEEQAEHLTWLRAFGESLDALIMASTGRDPKEQRGLILLKSYQIISTIFTSCCLDATELLYDAFNTDFSTAVYLCRSLVEPWGQSSQPHRLNLRFTNDLGVLPILAFAALKCRSPHVRKEVVSLLSRLRCREGSWDSQSIKKGIEELVHLEETGMDELGLIPPSARYAWTDCFWKSEGRLMDMEVSKVLPNIAGSFERRTLSVLL